MTANNPKVQAILVTCKSKDGETVLMRGVRLAENHDPSCVNDNWDYEPLIRLSDYEALLEKINSNTLKRLLTCCLKKKIFKPS